MTEDEFIQQHGRPMTPQECFDLNGYWPTTFVPSKPNKPKLTNPNGPYFSSLKADCFHVSGCKYGEEIHRLDRIWYDSHGEAAANRKPCKTCRS